MSGRTRSRFALTLALALFAAGCGGSHRPRAATSPAPTTAPVTITTGSATTTGAGTNATVSRPPARRRRAKLIAILPAAHRAGRFGWREAAAVRGVAAVWIARVGAFREPSFTVTLLRLNQRVATLALHAGSTQPGGSGWRYGSMVGAGERHRLLAAFNSAFEESYGAGGFVQDGRVGWPLRRGRASVVIYRDGTADIGTWRRGIPAPGRPVAAVRQNLQLLIDHGRIAGQRRQLHSPVLGRSAARAAGRGPLGPGRDGPGRPAVGGRSDALGPRLSRGACVARRRSGDGAGHQPGLGRRLSLRTPARESRGQPLALMPGQADVDSAFLGSYYRDFFTVLAR